MRKQPPALIPPRYQAGSRIREFKSWMFWQGLWLGFCSWRTLRPCSPTDGDRKGPSDQPRVIAGGHHQLLSALLASPPTLITHQRAAYVGWPSEVTGSEAAPPDPIRASTAAKRIELVIRAQAGEVGQSVRHGEK